MLRSPHRTGILLASIALGVYGCDSFSPVADAGDGSRTDAPQDGTIADNASDTTSQADGGSEAASDATADAMPSDLGIGPCSRQVGRRTIDGKVAEDCKGCGCGSWKVYGCYAETASYGEPWIDLVWQVGFDVLRFAITNGGKVQVTGKTPSHEFKALKVTVVTATIAAGGEVELDLDATVHFTDKFNKLQIWELKGHVVGRCK